MVEVATVVTTLFIATNFFCVPKSETVHALYWWPYARWNSMKNFEYREIFGEFGWKEFELYEFGGNKCIVPFDVDAPETNYFVDAIPTFPEVFFRDTVIKAYDYEAVNEGSCNGLP